MLNKWNIRRLFRAAYRPSGNGIVERHHRTIKAIAERAEISPLEAVYWYNSTPRSGQEETSVPQYSVYRYEWRHPAAVPDRSDAGQDNALSVSMGDEVWVKPRDARCTTQWRRGVITQVNSENNVSVDGMPRHVLDVRPVVVPDSPTAREESSEGNPSVEEPVELVDLSEETGSVRSRRNIRPPVWMADYVAE